LVGSIAEPLLIESIATGVIRQVGRVLNEGVKDTMLDSMADVLTRYFPKAPRLLDDNHLRPISDISPHASRLQSLRDFLRNPKAEFTCPEQAILLELMCQGKESVLGLLGTGKGKTMIVLLYAHMHGQRGVTVLVLPLSTLHDDFARRARERGVRTAQWSPTGKHNRDVQVLYVSIEHITFKQFQTYVVLIQ
jgi:superfamily II DNA helicase RecQ